MKRVLIWAPRVLCLLFAGFLGLFSFDVFGEGRSFLQTILALLMHLVPVFLIVIALAIAWRWELAGAILFNALALFYGVWAWGRLHWSACLAISGPLVLAGILFLFNWIYREQLRRQ